MGLADHTYSGLSGVGSCPRVCVSLSRRVLPITYAYACCIPNSISHNRISRTVLGMLGIGGALQLW